MLSRKLILLTLTFLIFGNSIHAIDKNVSVSATVAADATDFTATITKLTSGTTYSQGEVIDYEISYGSLLETSTNLTLVAEWEDESAVEYVTSSATNGYGSVSPVVDLVNKKLTWEFSSFPADTTGQTVRFSLRTLSSNTAASALVFAASTRIDGPGASTSDDSVTAYYTYVSTSTESSSTPTSTPTPTSNSSTQTPTPTLALPIFSSVLISELTSSSFSLSIKTNELTTIQLLYGDNTKVLNRVLRDSYSNDTHELRVSDLLPDHFYYYRLIAQTLDGKRYYSDLYIVKTAKKDTLLDLGSTDIQILWKKIPLISDTISTLISSKNQPITLNLTIADASSIKTLHAQFKNLKVLGQASSSKPLPLQLVKLVEYLPGIFAGEIQTPEKAGEFTIELTIQDIYGGIRKVSLPPLFINNDPIRIREKGSKKLVSNARVTVLRKDLKTNEYIDITQLLTLPDQTNRSGEFNLLLPLGSYIFEVQAPGYGTSRRSIQLSSKTSYPIIYMEKNTSLVHALFASTTYFLGTSAAEINDLLENQNVTYLVLVGQVLIGLALLVNLIFNKLLHGKTGLYPATNDEPSSSLIWSGRILFIELILFGLAVAGGFLILDYVLLNRLSPEILVAVCLNLALTTIYAHRVIGNMFKTRFV